MNTVLPSRSDSSPEGWAHRKKQLKYRWSKPGGYHEVLVVAIPFILSTASWSVQHFVDRMLFTWYAPEAIAAAMPAGMLYFSIVSIFMGIIGIIFFMRFRNDAWISMRVIESGLSGSQV